MFYMLKDVRFSFKPSFRLSVKALVLILTINRDYTVLELKCISQFRIQKL